MAVPLADLTVVESSGDIATRYCGCARWVSPPLRCPAPTLGQHNAEVLQQVLHMPSVEIEALERTGVIGTVAT